MKPPKNIDKLSWAKKRFIVTLRNYIQNSVLNRTDQLWDKGQVEKGRQVSMLQQGVIKNGIIA